MFYKHNNIGGRIQSADAGAYNPVGMGAKEAGESGFYFGDPRTTAISDGSFGAAVAEIHPRHARTKELQRLFQINDGVPIHLKLGMRDALVYRATVAGVGIGMGYMFYVFYKMAYGIKKR